MLTNYLETVKIWGYKKRHSSTGLSRVVYTLFQSYSSLGEEVKKILAIKQNKSPIQYFELNLKINFKHFV